MRKTLLFLSIGCVAVTFFTLGVLSGGLATMNYLELRQVNTAKVSTYTAGLKDGKTVTEGKLEEAWNQGYNDGFEEAKNQYQEGPGFPQNQKVGFKGNINLSGYNFYFVEEIEVDGEEYDGYSFKLNDTVMLKSGHFTGKTEDFCNHEVLHQLFPSFVHADDFDRDQDAVYFLQDKVDLTVCDYLVEKAVNRGSS